MAHQSQLPYIPFPPHRILAPAHAISAADALASVQSYLERAHDSPCLHPDATFSASEGPAFARHASEGGLVLQLLRRVERGLDGERIAAELPGRGPGLDDAEDDGAPGDGGFAGHNYMEQMEEEQAEGGITEGEIGARNNFVKDLTAVPGATKQVRKRKLQQTEEIGKLSKEDRKRAKKERQLAERQQKYRQNEQKNEAAQTNGVSEDVDMTEVPVLSPSDGEEEVIDKQKPVDTAVQNAPAAQDSKHAKEEEKRRRKQDKAARRSAKAEAKARAAHELHASDPNDEDNSQPPVVDDFEGERGKVQVVDRFGRDAETPNDKKKKKKNKKDKRDMTD